MKVKANFIYLIIIAFLIALLIIGHQINKKSSASKKNEISNIVNQLKTRNNQLAKIQKKLFDDGKNLNNIINKITINWKMNYKIILTGGYANLFKKIIKRGTIVDQNITIKGISKVY